jgi:hypothetical protein
VHTYIEKTRRRICDAVKIKHNSLHKTALLIPENLCDPLKSMSEKWVHLSNRPHNSLYNFNNSGLGYLVGPFFNDSLNDSLNHCIKKRLSVDA